jgi:hypothetical protein
MQRKGEPVKFPAIMRKTLPEHFPDFAFDPKQLRFTRLLMPQIQFWFSYKKDRSGLGKMFGIELGISLDEGVEFPVSIFRLFGTEMDSPSWVYHTHEELNLCIAESLQMLAKVLPAFQHSLCTYMGLDESSRPKWMQMQRAKSAREALAESLELAGVDEKDIGLQWIISWPRILGYARSPGPWTNDGVLNPEGVWKVAACKRDDMFCRLVIEYPYEGPIRFGWRPMSGWSPPIEKWIDSPDAVSQMRRIVKDSGEPKGLKLAGYAPPTWSGSLGRFDRLQISASSGAPLRIHSRD